MATHAEHLTWLKQVALQVLAERVTFFTDSFIYNML